jgi:hypothetical protein
MNKGKRKQTQTTQEKKIANSIEIKSIFSLFLASNSAIDDDRLPRNHRGPIAQQKSQAVHNIIRGG